MSDSTASLRRTIGSAGDLQSVVRTMKALATSSIGQYEQAVLALADYHRSVELGLGACLREATRAAEAAETVDASGAPAEATDAGAVAAIVFGSDQGLVGQFNEVVAEHVIDAHSRLPGVGAGRAGRAGRVQYWAVGERVHARLADAGLPMLGLFKVPGSVAGIAPLVGQIQVESEAHRAAGGHARVYVFHNRPEAGSVFTPVGQRLLPLDDAWRRGLAELRWPTGARPEVMDDAEMPDAGATLRAYVREHLFISLFRACAESLAAENASCLAAMERADKNIDEMLRSLQATFHRVRQNSIDDELFDVTAGFAALT